MAGQPESIVAGSVYAGIPSVVGEIANATRWLKGPMVYPVAALRALASWKPALFRIQIGGQDDSAGGSAAESGQADGASAAGPGPGPAEHAFAGYAVVVANSAYSGAGMQVAPPALVDDGVLDIVLMRQGPQARFRARPGEDQGRITRLAAADQPGGWH